MCCVSAGCMVHCFVTFVLLVYKGNTFVYAPQALGTEVFLELLLVGLESFRCSFGTFGNLHKKAGILGAFLWMTLPAAFLIAYQMNFQVYVLRADIILGGAAATFL